MIPLSILNPGTGVSISVSSKSCEREPAVPSSLGKVQRSQRTISALSDVPGFNGKSVINMLPYQATGLCIKTRPAYSPFCKVLCTIVSLCATSNSILIVFSYMRLSRDPCFS